MKKIEIATIEPHGGLTWTGRVAPSRLPRTMPESPLREVKLPCELPGFIGLILAAPTGVLYHQQCGGFWCNSMSLEGYMVPIGRSEATETRTRPDDQFTIDSYDLRSFFHTEEDGCPWGFVSEMPPEHVDRLEEQVGLLIPLLRHGLGGERNPIRSFEDRRGAGSLDSRHHS